MSMGGHKSPEFIDMLLQWITIFALILYGGMAFKRLGDLAPDLMIVKGVKYFFSKSKLVAKSSIRRGVKRRYKKW